MDRLLVALLLTVSLSLEAKEIRVSLLDDAVVLNETAALFLKNGSSAESIQAFKKAVRFHNANLFDLSKFPRKLDGLYSFQNVNALRISIADPFCEKGKADDMPHNSLECLDVAVLLIKDTEAKAPKLTEDFPAKCFAKYENRGSKEKPDYAINSVTSYSFYEHGRTLLYPTNGYTWITGLNRSAAEEYIAVSLKGERSLSGEYQDTDDAIRSLFATWNALRKRDGLEFPKKIKVVECGYIPMRFRYWAIDHVAVCVEEGGKLVCVEKNGPHGPFMRIDFNNEMEVGQYMAGKLLPDSRDPKEINYQAPVFISVNDQLIYIARP